MSLFIIEMAIVPIIDRKISSFGLVRHALVLALKIYAVHIAVEHSLSTNVKIVSGVKMDRCLDCGRWKTLGSPRCKRCSMMVRPCPVAPCPVMLLPREMEHHVLTVHPEPIVQWDPENDFDPGGEHGGVTD